MIKKIKITNNNARRSFRDTTNDCVYPVIEVPEGIQCPDGNIAIVDGLSFKDDVGAWVNIFKDGFGYEVVEELQEMLNTPEVNVTSLLNTKLDCRKADGTVDEELSRAFQEACFEQGIEWGDSGQVVDHINAAFLFADDNMGLYYEDFDEYFFNECNNNKQINFTYTRKLEWEATEVKHVEPVDEMVDICGVEYSAKELSEALALIKAARK